MYTTYILQVWFLFKKQEFMSNGFFFSSLFQTDSAALYFSKTSCESLFTPSNTAWAIPASFMSFLSKTFWSWRFASLEVKHTNLVGSFPEFWMFYKQLIVHWYLAFHAFHALPLFQLLLCPDFLYSYFFLLLFGTSLDVLYNWSVHILHLWSVEEWKESS